MSSNELMIGDYLLYGNLIVKVDMLRDNNISVVYNDSASLWFSTKYDGIYSHDINDLKPLELTEEMLLNNGFKFTDPWYANENCSMEIKKGENGKWIASKTGHLSILFNYVYELQHAMKLFNIKLEIVI